MRKIIVGIIILLICAAGAFWFFFPNIFSWLPSGLGEALAPQDVRLALGKTSGRAVPAGQREYYNPHYKFSLLFPDTLSAKEFLEPAGALTVTFEYTDEQIASGFQIFIAPFAGAQITEERFKQDIPSGVRESLKDITIDGAVGASFYSEQEFLGATAEVWFLRSGYLYEVTTLKELAPWLSGILATWKFTLKSADV